MLIEKMKWEANKAKKPGKEKKSKDQILNEIAKLKAANGGKLTKE